MPLFQWVSYDDDWDDIISLMIPILIVGIGGAVFTNYPDDIPQESVLVPEDCV